MKTAMIELNRIALDKEKTVKTVEHLNEILSNYQVFYQNLRGFHWNLLGHHFFSLHVKFEELYNEAQLNIDEIAERILTLGHTPLHTYKDYLKVSTVKAHKNISDEKKSVEAIIKNYATIIKKEREALPFASDAGDEGTADMLAGFIKAQEKTVWMLSAWLGSNDK
ncbi:DNA-binding ferritin-like protein (oxidative damage protectant) [Bernardetia litoralis DSM 6794]|uniref:DNA-binding ferritin-like protein (Oxidative damage protectant) n=1 Tax=Bernardetia litoralis (strain ATCC 23117 / DSM 6794 / NBRC 15988 / NCIMB 1366 / Fx l1 / Sio-4) TaxID=880071 RepID=I4AG64_BERLS|nr:Dps family protein [Bernardetia litoralis]AFM02949.1 DNA-binding ferritin-like protein (oxidative damage protectant) [Bernardetia litoralis DSM 6794]